jgi:hypothetical protein
MGNVTVVSRPASGNRTGTGNLVPMLKLKSQEQNIASKLDNANEKLSVEES